MRVLLLWNEIPETLKFFVIDDPTDEEIVVMKQAHGGCINTEGNTPNQEAALEIFNAALASPNDNSYFEDNDKPWVGRWHGKEIHEDALVNAGPFDFVISAGFVL